MLNALEVDKRNSTMLVMIEDADEKRAAQNQLELSVASKLQNQGLRNIGFPSGNLDEVIFANSTGELWAAFGVINDAAVPRRWNSFGVFDTTRQSQEITVEINIPTTSNSARVAGFFARDPTSGDIYLMHDGGIGGGRLGVGKRAFLAWSRTSLEEVACKQDKVRSGIVVGNLSSDDLVARIWRFVLLIKGFKDAIRTGELDDPSLRKAIAEWEIFNSESSGRRQGTRRSAIDYLSYHGDVVELLYRERQLSRVDDEQILNNQLIDLFVRKGKIMTEIYEVKTSLARQSIYTAIGQLLSHSVDAAPSVKRTLVVPEGALPSDLERCLDFLSIELRRFNILDAKDPKVVLD